jgi:hypothetical protein
MKDMEVLKKKIEEDADYIFCPRLGNSLIRFLYRYPDGVEEDRIQTVLMLTKEELVSSYESAIRKLRDFVVKPSDDEEEKED